VTQSAFEKEMATEIARASGSGFESSTKSLKLFESAFDFVTGCRFVKLIASESWCPFENLSR
jgi:hypothetical protein